MEGNSMIKKILKDLSKEDLLDLLASYDRYISTGKRDEGDSFYPVGLNEFYHGKYKNRTIIMTELRRPSEQILESIKHAPMSINRGEVLGRPRPVFELDNDRRKKK